jgi:hypothetical protein
MAAERSMTNYESGRYEMFKRMRNFGIAHRDRFSAASYAAKALALVSTAIGERQIMRRVLTLVMCAGAMTGCAHVQATQSWPELAHRLSNGKTVVVTTAGQAEVAGTVSAVSSDSLTLVIDQASRRFDARDVRQVRRDGDPLWNGLAIGGGVGLLGAILPDNKCSGQPLRCDDRQIPQRAAFLAAAIAAGIGIDALHRDRTVLYQSPSRVMVRLVPALTAESKSLSIAISTR